MPTFVPPLTFYRFERPGKPFLFGRFPQNPKTEGGPISYTRAQITYPPFLVSSALPGGAFFRPPVILCRGTKVSSHPRPHLVSSSLAYPVSSFALLRPLRLFASGPYSCPSDHPCLPLHVSLVAGAYDRSTRTGPSTVSLVSIARCRSPVPMIT